MSWSSYHANAWGDAEELLTAHPVYQSLAVSIEQHCYRYRELFREALSPEDIHAFREATHYSMPIGSDYFRVQIERKLERSLGYMGRGRPRFGLVKK